MSSNEQITILLKVGEFKNIKLSGGGDTPLKVVKIDSKSPAYKKGLRQGDSLESVNGASLNGKSENDFLKLMEKSKSAIVLAVTRGGVGKVKSGKLQKSTEVQSTAEKVKEVQETVTEGSVSVEKVTHTRSSETTVSSSKISGSSEALENESGFSLTTRIESQNSTEVQSTGNAGKAKEIQETVTEGSVSVEKVTHTTSSETTVSSSQVSGSSETLETESGFTLTTSIEDFSNTTFDANEVDSFPQLSFTITASVDEVESSENAVLDNDLVISADITTEESQTRPSTVSLDVASSESDPQTISLNADNSSLIFATSPTRQETTTPEPPTQLDNPQPSVSDRPEAPKNDTPETSIENQISTEVEVNKLQSFSSTSTEESVSLTVASTEVKLSSDEAPESVEILVVESSVSEVASTSPPEPSSIVSQPNAKLVETSNTVSNSPSATLAATSDRVSAVDGLTLADTTSTTIYAVDSEATSAETSNTAPVTESLTLDATPGTESSPTSEAFDVGVTSATESIKIDETSTISVSTSLDETSATTSITTSVSVDKTTAIATSTSVDETTAIPPPTPVDETPAAPTPVVETPAAPTPVDETPAIPTPTPVVETPAAPTPVVETPAAPTPVVETPAAPTPVVETPAAPTPVAETPAVPTPTPVVETPAAPTPVVETPAAPTPVVETPAVPTPTPVVETPAAPTPVVETPAAPTPVVETPAVPTPTPVVETPAAPTPVVETPAAPTPVVETPAVPTPTPVVETPAVPTPTPVVETPAAPTPVVETPAVPTPTPVVETPAIPTSTPVVETPAIPTSTPVDETTLIQVDEISDKPTSTPADEASATLVDETPPTPVDEISVTQTSTQVNEISATTCIIQVDETSTKPISTQVDDTPATTISIPVDETPATTSSTQVDETPPTPTSTPVDETPPTPTSTPVDETTDIISSIPIDSSPTISFTSADETLITVAPSNEETSDIISSIPIDSSPTVSFTSVDETLITVAPSNEETSDIISSIPIDASPTVSFTSADETLITVAPSNEETSAAQPRTPQAEISTVTSSTLLDETSITTTSLKSDTASPLPVQVTKTTTKGTPATVVKVVTESSKAAIPPSPSLSFPSTPTIVLSPTSKATSNLATSSSKLYDVSSFVSALLPPDESPTIRLSPSRDATFGTTYSTSLHSNTQAIHPPWRTYDESKVITMTHSTRIINLNTAPPFSTDNSRTYIPPTDTTRALNDLLNNPLTVTKSQASTYITLANTPSFSNVSSINYSKPLIAAPEVTRSSGSDTWQPRESTPVFRPTKFTPGSAMEQSGGLYSTVSRFEVEKENTRPKPIFQVSTPVSGRAPEVWRPNSWVPGQDKRHVTTQVSTLSSYPSASQVQGNYSWTDGQHVTRTTTQVSRNSYQESPQTQGHTYDNRGSLKQEKLHVFGPPVEIRPQIGYQDQRYSQHEDYQHAGLYDELSSADSFGIGKRNVYSDSAFYDTPSQSYPTIPEQMKLCKKIAQSLTSEANNRARGARMFMKRMRKSSGWIHGTLNEFSQCDRDVANLQDLDSDFSSGEEDFGSDLYFRVPDLHDRLTSSRPIQMALNPLQFEELRLNAKKCAHTAISPELCFDIVADLKAHKGRGGRLFERRKKRSDKFIVDDTTVKAVAPSTKLDVILSQTPRKEITPWQAAMNHDGNVDAAFYNLSEWEAVQKQPVNRSPSHTTQHQPAFRSTLKRDESPGLLQSANFNRTARGWPGVRQSRIDDNLRHISPPRQPVAMETVQVHVQPDSHRQDFNNKLKSWQNITEPAYVDNSAQIWPAHHQDERDNYYSTNRQGQWSRAAWEENTQPRSWSSHTHQVPLSRSWHSGGQVSPGYGNEVDWRGYSNSPVAHRQPIIPGTDL